MGCKAWRDDKYREIEVIGKNDVRKEKILWDRFTEVHNGSVCGSYSYQAIL